MRTLVAYPIIDRASAAEFHDETADRSGSVCQASHLPKEARLRLRTIQLAWPECRTNVFCRSVTQIFPSWLARRPQDPDHPTDTFP